MKKNQYKVIKCGKSGYYVKINKEIEKWNKILYIINISKGLKTENSCKIYSVFTQLVVYFSYRYVGTIKK